MKLNYQPRRRSFILLALVWASIISNFSNDNFSAAKTAPYIERWLGAIAPSANINTIHTLHILIRKSAHFIEYGIFALLLFGIWAAGALPWPKRPIIYVIGIVASFALLDEYHQSFVRSRLPSIWDSLIDTLGGISALALLWLAQRKKFQT